MPCLHIDTEDDIEDDTENGIENDTEIRSADLQSSPDGLAASSVQ